MVSITPDEIALLSKYVNQITGIKLDPEKGYLLESRFQPLISEFQCNSYKELYQKAQSDRTGSIMNRMVDAITTNETYFFRDNKPFELLTNKIIPDIIDQKRQSSGSRQISLRIWSAACSTGQEIYSIGITLNEILKDLRQHNITILGTDISDDVVARASYGQYNRFEVERGLPANHLKKYFTKTANGWRIKDLIRTMARFEKRDLLKPFNDLGQFDIIFCRNVAIYFDNADKRNLFKKISQSMLPGGSLIVGASESLTGIADEFIARHYLNSIYYQLKKDIPAKSTRRVSPSVDRPRSPVPSRPTPPARPVSTRKPAPARPKPKKPEPVVKPGPQQPPPAAPVKPVAVPAAANSPEQAPKSGRSLLAGIGRVKQGKEETVPTKGSLLSRIQSNQSDSKKSLLSDISSIPENKQ